MTKDKALKLAIEALELCDGNGLKDYDFCIAIHKCKTALIACKEALEQPAQEPVAWVCGGELYLTKEAADDSKRDWSLVPNPLYTRPAQPCQECENLKHDLESYMEVAHAYANQKPLSDEKISLMAHNDDSGDWNDLRFRDCWYEGYKKGARALEKAHGIGVEND